MDQLRGDNPDRNIEEPRLESRKMRPCRQRSNRALMQLQINGVGLKIDIIEVAAEFASALFQIGRSRG